MQRLSTRRWALLLTTALVLAAVSMPAQQMVTETRDPAQTQDEDFAKSVKEWTTQPYFISPLVDHLPKVNGVPSPKDVLGYHIGAPAKLTYYADIVKYYRALADRAAGTREDRDDRQVGRGSRAGRRLDLVGRQHREPPEEPRQPGAASPIRAAAPPAEIRQLDRRRPSRNTT